MCLHDPKRTKKITWYENGNHHLPQNTRNLFIDSLIGSTLRFCLNLKIYEKELNSLKVNKVEVKGESSDASKFKKSQSGK